MMFALLRNRRNDPNRSRKAELPEQEGFPRTITMQELLNRHPELIPEIIGRNLYCVGCLLAPFHDVTDAAIEHGIDEDGLYLELLKAAGKSEKAG